jgi:hypothetical protein
VKGMLELRPRSAQYYKFHISDSILLNQPAPAPVWNLEFEIWNLDGYASSCFADLATRESSTKGGVRVK